MQGSVWMGMGQAMSEEVAYHEGLMLTANMLDYRVPTIEDSPPIEVGIVESNDPHGPFGAKEAGEGSLAAFLPALTNAIADAIGLRFNDLPVTPDRVFAALEKRQRAAAKTSGSALMDALPEFEVVRPTTLDDVIAARAAHPDSQLLGGGTDLVVNIRRGIVAPPVLIDVNRVRRAAHHQGRRAVARDRRRGDARRARRASGRASSTIRWWRRRPRIIAGPTHRHMGTVGGNLCLDTRCIYYNQSEWWRAANHHCLKTTGEICHVAPKSRGVCFATFSGDLAPALLTLGAEVELAGPQGRRTVPLASLYIGHARQDQPVTETMGDGKFFLALRPGRVRRRGARAATRPACARPTTRSASAARSSIRSPASRWRCAATATRSPICASPSPAPTRGRCCSPAPPSSAAVRSTTACSRGSTSSPATRSWR